MSHHRIVRLRLAVSASPVCAADAGGELVRVPVTSLGVGPLVAEQLLAWARAFDAICATIASVSVDKGGFVARSLEPLDCWGRALWRALADTLPASVEVHYDSPIQGDSALVRDADTSVAATAEPEDVDFDLLARQARTHTQPGLELYKALVALPLWYFLIDPATHRVAQWHPCIPAFTSAQRAGAFAREAGLLDANGVAGVAGIEVAHAVAWLRSFRTQGLTWACFNLGPTSVDFPLYFEQLETTLFAQRRPAEDPAPGDLVSVAAGDGPFSVAKVLAVDADAIHVRLYGLRFERRPLSVSLHQLVAEPYVPGQALRSFGHLPLRRRTFLQWRPRLIDRGLPVTDDELLGYELWRRQGGDCF